MLKYFDTVLKTDGRPLSGATIVVKDYPAGSVATIYSDDGITPISSLTTDSNGYFEFYGANGKYSLVISGDDITTKTIDDIELRDHSSFIDTLLDDADADSALSTLGFSSFGKTLIDDTTAKEAKDTLQYQVAGVTALKALTPVDGEIVYLKYHTSQGDGGHGEFEGLAGASAGTYTDDDGVTILPTGGDGSSCWLRRIDGPVSSAFFGTGAGGDVASAFSAWAAYVSDNMDATVPAGIYTLSSGFGFAASNITIRAYGAKFNFTATSDVLIDLYKDATASEAVVKSNIRWYGGRFECSTSGNGGNTNVGIRCRGITRGDIAHVFGQDFGASFISFNPREAVTVRDWHGYLNNIHLEIENFQDTSAGNPQVCTLKDFGLSTFYTAGIRAKGIVNDLYISSGFLIGDNAIDVETGESATYSGNNAQGLHLTNISFEQGATDGFYIQTRNTNAKSLLNMSVEGCTFSGTDVKVADIKSTKMFSFSDNYVVSTKTGWLTFDSACQQIDIGVNRFFATSFPAITYSCARSQIAIYPYTVTIDHEVLTGFNLNSFSTSSGTIDMPTAFASFPSIAPPKGYDVSCIARDSASSTSQPYIRLKQTTGTTNDKALTLSIEGISNTFKQGMSGYVPADSSGDIAYAFTASGTDTLDVLINVTGYRM